jgi:hypothetical protein
MNSTRRELVSSRANYPKTETVVDAAGNLRVPGDVVIVHLTVAEGLGPLLSNVQPRQ